ncbi:MAG TPA: intradiol ring-cleavage dioxygenase [Verrucomicrobiae bacterium]|nr:intradiol ring-cleavage dioxygenase [Verrucomicrobiae bacterium]
MSAKFDATRRGVFGLAAALPIAACANGATAQVGAITLTPQSVEGPYYFDPALERADIREDRVGVPLTLALKILGSDGRAFPNARVDIWHCDASGAYSGYAGQGDARVDMRNAKFLRGTQFSNATGDVAFQTIYPGWYQGRTAHIHFKVFLNQQTVLTAQMYFPDALSEYLYKHAPPYQRQSARDTFNATDGIAQNATYIAFAAIKEEADHYVASLTIGVDPNAQGMTGDQMGGGFGGPPPGGERGPPPEGFGPRRVQLSEAERVRAIVRGLPES